jgi:type IV pilus assembly protein PilA
MELAAGSIVLLHKESALLATLRQRLNAKDESGFTLIELLVVLIIIGVLLAIAVPSYLGFKDKAQKTAAASDVREAEPSAEAFYSDNNTYSGLSISALQGYDSGLQAYSAGPPAVPGVVTVKGGATKYCISALNGSWYSHVVGPGGQVATGESTDFCSTWTPS